LAFVATCFYVKFIAFITVHFITALLYFYIVNPLTPNVAIRGTATISVVCQTGLSRHL